MRRIALLLSLLSLTACNRFMGPLEVREKRRTDPVNAPAPDGSRYTIEEQERRARERLSYPRDDFRIGPNTNADRTDPVGL